MLKIKYSLFLTLILIRSSSTDQHYAVSAIFVNSTPRDEIRLYMMKNYRLLNSMYIYLNLLLLSQL